RSPSGPGFHPSPRLGTRLARRLHLCHPVARLIGGGCHIVGEFPQRLVQPGPPSQQFDDRLVHDPALTSRSNPFEITAIPAALTVKKSWIDTGPAGAKNLALQERAWAPDKG